MGDRLKDKMALVSGAGSRGPGWGNGKATAVLFAREGAKVLAADIDLDAALDYEAHLQDIACRTKDHAAGLGAFTEKRPARFTGQ